MNTIHIQRSVTETMIIGLLTTRREKQNKAKLWTFVLQTHLCCWLIKGDEFFSYMNDRSIQLFRLSWWW